MRILRLYIQGCGVFKSNLIDFTHNGEPQNLICLAGVNGSGKTTVMELVFSLISFLNPSLAKYLNHDRLKLHILTRTEFAQLDILINNEVLSVVYGSSSEKQGDSNQYIIIPRKLSSPRLRAVMQNHRNLWGVSRVMQEPPKRLTRILQSQVLGDIIVHTDGEIKTLLDNILDNIDVVLPKAAALPFTYFFNAHDREIHDIRYANVHSVLENIQKYQVAGKYQPWEDDIKKTLIYYDYAYPAEFEKLKSWINEHVLVDKSIEGIDRPNFEVIIRTQNGTTHGLELLSFGEESLLIVAIQCFLRASKNAVFMIDEVDQSLHPEFQEKIMMLLTQLQKDTDCQIIVSSHSETIWRIFDSQGLIDLTSVVMT